MTILRQPLALYIHWPWCKEKCPYCDFNSHVLKNDMEDAYVNALLRDLDMQLIFLDNKKKQELSTIFFGGGTPSLMKLSSIDKILNHVAKRFSLHNNIEITLECNPTSIETNKIQQVISSGINRLSIGIQSLDNHLLEFLGRTHSVENALTCLDVATQHCNNVNADLIYGIPGQTLEAWQQQLYKILEHGTQHISAYQLTIEPNTKFYAEVNKKSWLPITSDEESDFYHYTRETFISRGWHNYEISNFAKTRDFYCAHNYNIWNYHPYIGIGAGAHGRVAKNKNYFASQHKKNPHAYMSFTYENERFPYIFQHISHNQHDEEALLMGLRLQDGIALSRLRELNKTPVFNNKINALITYGFLEKNKDILRLTQSGWYMLDGVLYELLYAK